MFKYKKAMNDVMYWSVIEAVSGAAHRDTTEVVDYGVNSAVREAVNWAVNWAVRDAAREDLQNPALGDFLQEVGA